MPNAKQGENPDIFTDLRDINVFLKKRVKRAIAYPATIMFFVIFIN